MRRFVRALVAALCTAAFLPLLFIAAESAVQGAPVVPEDFGFAYTLVAPFALITALAVAWPSYSLQRADLPLPRRLVAASIACFCAPVAIFLLLADDFPWKAGVAGVATLLIWAAAYHLAGRLVPYDLADRSKPSG